MPAEVVMGLADDARAIGKSLIAEHHRHLQDAEIIYVFTSQQRKRCDRIRLGSAAKLNALQRFLSSGMEAVSGGHDFMILIDQTLWRELTNGQRQALIDHELCHCVLFVKDESERPAQWLLWNSELDDPDSYADRRWGLRGHDIEEFADVLKRHGWWKPDSREKGFGEIALQLTLPNGKAPMSRRAELGTPPEYPA